MAVVKFTTWSGRFNSGKEPQYPMNRRMGGLKAYPDVLERRKKSLANTGIRTLDLPV